MNNVYIVKKMVFILEASLLLRYYNNCYVMEQILHGKPQPVKVLCYSYDSHMFE